MEQRSGHLTVGCYQRKAAQSVPQLRAMDTMDDRRDVWIAFVLSLAVPGAGQLWKRSSSCIFWLAAVAFLLVFWGLVRENFKPVAPHWQVISFLVLGVASGLHASRIAARTAADAGIDSTSD